VIKTSWQAEIRGGLSSAVEQAQATADLGKVTDQRTSRLVAQGWSSAEQGARIA
jgi:hypothetical protein